MYFPESSNSDNANAWRSSKHRQLLKEISGSSGAQSRSKTEVLRLTGRKNHARPIGLSGDNYNGRQFEQYCRHMHQNSIVCALRAISKTSAKQMRADYRR